MLNKIRKEIDNIDNQIMDLLLKRLELVGQVGKWKEKNIQQNQIFIKPHREAEVVREMLAKNNGKYPDNTIINIWRNIISASVNSEKKLSICAFVPTKDETNYWLAREYFGNVCDIDKIADANQIVANVAEGKHSIGVISIDETDEADEADEKQKWWLDMPDDVKIFAEINNSSFCIARINLEKEEAESFFCIFETRAGKVLDKSSGKIEKFLAKISGKIPQTQTTIGSCSNFK